MAKSSFAVKLEKEFQDEFKEFCESRGLKQGPFVEKAIREQMEREELAEDLLDLYMLKTGEQNAIPLEEYLKKRQR